MQTCMVHPSTVRIILLRTTTPQTPLKMPTVPYILRHNLIKIEQRRELLKTTLPMHQLPKQPPPSLWTIQLPYLHSRKVTAAASGAIHRISSRRSLPSTKLSSSSSDRAAVVLLCHVSSSNDMPPIQESYASLLVISCATKLYCWRYMKANSTSSYS